MLYEVITVVGAVLDAEERHGDVRRTAHAVGPRVVVGPLRQPAAQGAEPREINIIIFPRRFRDETTKLLKSLNWVKLDIPEDLCGTVSQMIKKSYNFV